MNRELNNWLESYLEFSQNTEPPTIYHLWSGIVAISSCLQRKCYLDWGYESIIYPNLYAVLVGPPGGRKGTAMKIAKALLRKLDIVLGSDSLGSIQTLYEEIAGAESNYIDHLGVPVEHKSLSVWSEEFQVFLADSDPRLISNITDLFDSPSHWRYSSIGRGIRDLGNCWLTIFGATTPSLLQSSLTQDAVGGGLVSRIIFVVGYGKAKKVPITFFSRDDQERQDKLLHDLERIKNLSGQFKPTQEFMDAYTKWYMSPNATNGVDSEKFVGYNERRALHLRKLCMIFAVAEDDSMELKAHHFKRALHVLEMTEIEMENAFYGLGQGAHSTAMTNVMRFLQDNGTISWGKLLDRFKMDIMPVELQSFVDTLVQSGHIKEEIDAGKRRFITFLDDKGEKEQTKKDFYKHELFKKLYRGVG
ncbi:MAG: DUF3987 domain-containing protein [Dehalococcoidia bacterium]